MVRVLAVMLACLVPAFPVRAADISLEGNWKVLVPFLQGGGAKPLWLIQLENKDGKWSGRMLAAAERWPKGTVEDVRLTGDTLHFTLKLTDISFSFQGKVSGDRGTILYGSTDVRGEATPMRLERTTTPSLDSFELAREALARGTVGYEPLQAALSLLQEAEDHKAKPE